MNTVEEVKLERFLRGDAAFTVTNFKRRTLIGSIRENSENFPGSVTSKILLQRILRNQSTAQG